jgi:hypothetical protein
VKAKLVGCDVVYTLLITSYDSIASTLVSSADTSDTVVDVFVTMLDDAQLRRMHETEGGYHIARLLDVSTTRITFMYRKGSWCDIWNELLNPLCLPPF